MLTSALGLGGKSAHANVEFCFEGVWYEVTALDRTWMGRVSAEGFPEEAILLRRAREFAPHPPPDWIPIADSRDEFLRFMRDDLESAVHYTMVDQQISCDTGSFKLPGEWTLMPAAQRPAGMLASGIQPGGLAMWVSRDDAALRTVGAEGMAQPQLLSSLAAKDLRLNSPTVTSALSRGDESSLQVSGCGGATFTLDAAETTGEVWAMRFLYLLVERKRLLLGPGQQLYQFVVRGPRTNESATRHVFDHAISTWRV